MYRVAHNVAASHVLKHRRAQTLVGIDDLEQVADRIDAESAIDRQITLERLHALIHQLRTVDREVILLYLEGLDAAAIGEITGISAANVATKIHRIKKILARHFTEGGRDGR